MRRFVMLMGGALVAAGLTVGAMAHEGEHKEGEEGKKVTVTGELIDTACFITSDGDAMGKEHAECGTKCLASGVPAGILPQGAKDEHDLMFLLTNPVPLAPYVGQTIKVEGKQFEHVHALDAQKVFVKDGSNWKPIALQDEHHKMGGDSKKDDMGGMKMEHKEGDAHSGHAH